MSVDNCVTSKDQGENINTRNFQPTLWLSSAVKSQCCLKASVFLFSPWSFDITQIYLETSQVGVAFFFPFKLLFIYDTYSILSSIQSENNRIVIYLLHHQRKGFTATLPRNLPPTISFKLFSPSFGHSCGLQIFLTHCPQFLKHTILFQYSM